MLLSYFCCNPSLLLSKDNEILNIFKRRNKKTTWKETDFFMKCLKKQDEIITWLCSIFKLPMKIILSHHSPMNITIKIMVLWINIFLILHMNLFCYKKTYQIKRNVRISAHFYSCLWFNLAYSNPHIVVNSAVELFRIW